MKKGQAALTLVIFFLFISIAVGLGATESVISESRIVRYLYDSKTSYFLAEAGLEDSFARIRSGEILPAGDRLVQLGSRSVSVNVGGTSDVILSATGITGAGISRNVSVSIIRGEGINFSYGFHVGENGIEMGSGSNVNGSIYSNGNITGSGTIAGSALAVGTIAAGVTVYGVKQTGLPVLPLEDIDTDYWKSVATKITGNKTLGNNDTWTIGGPIWITGNLTMNNGSKIIADPALGSQGTVVLVDGNMHFGNMDVLTTPSSPKGYILFYTPKSGGDAVEIDNGADVRAIVMAPNGDIELGNAVVSSISGKKVKLANNSDVSYETGIIDARFSGGPTGGWNVADWGEK